MKMVLAFLVLGVLVAVSGCAMNDYLDGNDHSSHYDNSQYGHSGHMH